VYTVIYAWSGLGSSYATEQILENFHSLFEVYM